MYKKKSGGHFKSDPFNFFPGKLVGSNPFMSQSLLERNADKHSGGHLRQKQCSDYGQVSAAYMMSFNVKYYK